MAGKSESSCDPDCIFGWYEKQKTICSSSCRHSNRLYAQHDIAPSYGGGLVFAQFTAARNRCRLRSHVNLPFMVRWGKAAMRNFFTVRLRLEYLSEMFVSPGPTRHGAWARGSLVRKGHGQPPCRSAFGDHTEGCELAEPVTFRGDYLWAALSTQEPRAPQPKV
jgi:hypothetical protein